MPQGARPTEFFGMNEQENEPGAFDLGDIVDAKGEQARGRYERYEFERLPDSPLSLWFPTGAIGALTG